MDKWDRREKKNRRKIRVNGKSVFVILQIQYDRAEKLSKKKRKKTHS